MNVQGKAHNQIFWPIVPLLICALLLLVFLLERPLTIIIQKVFSHNIPYSISKSQDNRIIHFNVEDKYTKYINYIDISFRFKLAEKAQLDNLFQTADVNSGIRAEMLGGVIGLVMPEVGNSNKIRGFNLTDRIHLDKWYDFNLFAILKSSLSANIGGRNVLSSLEYRPEFKIDRIAVGAGFSLTRPFGGAIEDVRVRIASAPSRDIALLVILAIKALLIGAILVSIRFARWPVVPATERGEPVRRAYDPLLFLRAIACALVVVGHGVMIAFRPADLSQMAQQNSFSGILSASPWGGVWVFFTLSGYLMGKAFFLARYPLSSEGIFAFYRNRILRIVPLYWASIIIVCAFEFPSVFTGANFPSMVRIILLDNDGELSVNPIGALWSICTEMQFYLLAPLIFSQLFTIVGVMRKIIICVCMFFIFGLTFRIGVIEFFGWGFWQREVYKTLIGNIDLFMLGFVLNAILVKKLGSGTRAAAYGAYALLAIVVAFASWVSAQGMIVENRFWHDFLFQVMPSLVALFVCAIIFLFEISPANPVRTLLNFPGRIVGWLGLMTYAIYVWHEPLFVSFARHIAQSAHISDAYAQLALSMIPVGLVGFIMWKFIEIPFERKKHFVGPASASHSKPSA